MIYTVIYITNAESNYLLQETAVCPNGAYKTKSVVFKVTKNPLP